MTARRVGSQTKRSFKRSNAIVQCTMAGTAHLIVPSGFKVLQMLKRNKSSSYDERRDIHALGG